MSAPAAARTGRTARYTVGVLFLVSLVNAFDRNIASVLAEPLRAEWSLSDAQLGALFGVFMVSYAIGGIPLGRLADRKNRTRIIAIGVFVWSLLTGLGALAGSYLQLLFMRMGVGIGEAAYMPASLSIVGDELPPTRRAKAVAMVMAGIPLGVASSFAIGGAVAKKFGWRAAFLVAVVPGLLCSFAALGIREPARGGAEESAIGASQRPGSYVRVLLGIPTLWIITLATSLFFVVVNSFGTFMLPLLMRLHGLPLDKAGASVGLIVGLSPVFGMIASGVAADRLRARRMDAPFLIMGASCALAAPLMVLALAQPAGHSKPFVALMALTVLGISPLIALSQTAIQDVVEPSLRGSAVAFHGFVSSLIGAVGPVVVGRVSDGLARAAARTAGVDPAREALLEPFRPQALHDALYITVGCIAVISLMLLASLAKNRRDVTRLREWETRAAPPTG
ncbi:MAG: MFS transporter [Polyangiales bacterium]